ncbi:MAG TPA: glycosyltransferase [Terracidiphilus sp.]|nr:glycosyltransferase [Terracidiphilus sp.]
MRILHVIDTLSPAAGGPPEAIRQLVRAYEQEVAGARIEVVCLDRPGEPFLSGIPCPVHALGQTVLGRFAFSPRLWRWLHAHANRFDVVLMNGIWSFPDIAVRSAARRSGVPYGVFVHGALDPWFNRAYPLKRLKKMLYWPMQYRVLHDAAAVFFTTTIERDLAQTSFRPSRWNSIVIPYGITDYGESAEDSARQVELFYGATPALRGRNYLLFLGRIHEKKGCDLLLEAFGRQASHRADVDLVIAGPDQGGLQSKLKAQADRLGLGGRVHWPSMLRGDLKWGAVRACEAFVLPSHQENFGISVVEALAAGRPVLISNQVNIWPEIEADGVGLVEEDTLAGTERLLHRWFETNSAEREAMATRARPCFLARYTMNRTASVINEIFGPQRVQSETRSGKLEIAQS